MSALSKGVADKTGADLQSFLLAFPYVGTTGERPDTGPFDGPDAVGYLPDSLGELSYLANVGKLDQAAYLKFLSAYAD